MACDLLGISLVANLQMNRILRLPAGARLVLTVLAGLALWTLVGEVFRPQNRLLSWPARTLNEGLFPVYGPVDCEIVFPTGKVGKLEPLVATGNRKAADVLYVQYESTDTLRIGLVSVGMKGPLSDPIKVTYGQPHHLRVYLGSLVPPDWRLSLAGTKLTETQLADLRRTLRVELDGRPVFTVPARFTPTKPSEVLVGATKYLRAFAPTDFTGTISQLTRPAIAPLPVDPPTEFYGPFRLTVRFHNSPGGAGQPLVVTGVPGAGDFIYATCTNNHTLVLGYDHWNGPGFASAPMTVDFDSEHTLEITLGSLYPPKEHRYWHGYSDANIARLKKLVQIKLDGQVVLEKEQEPYASLPRDVYIGRNIIGGSTCLYEFAGTIKSTQRLEPPRPATP